jgi:hypothetical protein
VVVADERGVFVVRGANRDGSLKCVAEDGGGGFRAFLPEWVAVIAGGKARHRSAPPEAVAARAAWREAHGWHSARRAAEERTA